jgi:hypothetical protein
MLSRRPPAKRVERECARIAPRVRQWISGHVRRPVRQPRFDLGGLAGIQQMGILAALLCSGRVRRVQLRITSACIGAGQVSL